MAETPTTAGSTANRVVNNVFRNVTTRVLQEDNMMPSRTQAEHSHKDRKSIKKKCYLEADQHHLSGKQKKKISINQNINFTEYTKFSPSYSLMIQLQKKGFIFLITILRQKENHRQIQTCLAIPNFSLDY